MAEDNDQEKSEPATPQKREKAKEEGQVAQTRELPSALVFGASLLVFSSLATWMWDHLEMVFRMPLTLIGQVEITATTLRPILKDLLVHTVVLLGPLLGIIVTVGVAAHVVQTGLMFSPKALEPKLDRINPLEGAKRFISLRGLVEAVKNIAKIVVIGFVVWRTVNAETDQLLNMTNQDAWAVMTFVLIMAFRIFVRVAVLLLILAALDYAYQRYEHEKKLRMTKQEIKDEMKQSEGDPKVKARIRSIQREIAMRRMMQEVPEADVIITNPTHVAVAIKYEALTDLAPRVVAKGQGHVALKIREEAKLHGVPLLERPELARELYRLVKLGQAVPPQLYQALAEILAYVYNLKERRSV
ncbi:MAG: flagellar biosynthesis protein FlhB [Candidatus Lernaella stagnicola]|nr:flagellar biosynthesis protein FlhB [Candidatus Lernaella stagnicola]